MDFKKQLKEGLVSQNPVTVQLLGMCSTMAITTSLFNGIGMGLSVLVILTLSNIFISALRKVIPPWWTCASRPICPTWPRTWACSSP